MDEDIKGKGPGIHGCTPEGRHCIKDSLDDSSTIVLGRVVTYAEMMSTISTTPKSPSAPVTEAEFWGRGR